MSVSYYEKLGSPGERVADPRYVIEYKTKQWGIHRLGYKSLLLAIQIHHAIPTGEFPAYLLNHEKEEVTIRRLSGNKAAEAMTLKEIYELRHGPDTWKDLRKKITKGYK